MSARHHLDIGPMPTAEEMAARRRRLLGPAKVINIHRPPKQEQPHDAHVTAYREYLDRHSHSASPIAYLRYLCRINNVSYDTIAGRSRACEVIAVKHRLIWEVRQQFPDASLAQIGRAFGGIDHTTVLHALKKNGHVTATSEDIEDKIRRALALREAGMHRLQIAAEIGCHEDTVRLYLNPDCRNRRRESNRRHRQRKAGK